MSIIENWISSCLYNKMLLLCFPWSVGSGSFSSSLRWTPETTFGFSHSSCACLIFKYQVYSFPNLMPNKNFTGFEQIRLYYLKANIKDGLVQRTQQREYQIIPTNFCRTLTRLRALGIRPSRALRTLLLNLL